VRSNPIRAGRHHGVRRVIPRAAAAFLAALALAHGVPEAVAQQPTDAPAAPASGPVRGNPLNPDISVVGWIQYSTEHESEEAWAPAEVREMELGLQSAVDPYSRADIFIAFSSAEGADVEEAYLTFLALPNGFLARLGKHRSLVTRFNRVHPPETAFATRPLVSETFFGEEGLAVVGASLSRLIPNPWDIYVNLDLEVSDAPDESGVFLPADREDLLYGGRLNAFVDLSESVNLALGGALYTGPFGFDATAEEARRSWVSAADVTLRWKDPRRAIDRSFLWTTEALRASIDPEDAAAVGAEEDRPVGFFTHTEYQFARRWRLGGRYDWTEIPEGAEAHEAGALGYLTFTPSEFSLVSLQGDTRRDAAGEWDDRLFLKVTFNMGPHGAHPF